jgi:aminopeptidase N
VILTPPPAALPRRGVIASRPPEMITLPAASPASRMKQLSDEIGWAMEWMAARFGPPPARNLSVSPIPGNFGQGFPGLIYLSTRAFVDLADSSKERQLFFEELLPIHETAHQWWGNLITSAAYEDDWLHEAFANYLALMGMEQRRGARQMDSMLTEYRERLLTKDSEGQEPGNAGPVVLGLRLQNSHSSGAWRTIIYDKGSWILHMLRRRMGDALFWDMLTAVAARYREQPFSTEDFRAVASEFLARQPKSPESYVSVDPKLESFFDTWVYGTGVPALKLTSTLRGKAPKVQLTLTVTQSGAGEDFSDAVPVEIHLGRNRVLRQWIRTGSEPSVVTVSLPAAPVKVTLDPGGATLRR